MANLIVSAVCNRSCTYCFAADPLRRDRPQGAAATAPFLSLDSFQNRLDFLTRSGLDQVRLLGGEPTLHPDFDTLVARARQSGKRITVFTNGLMPPSALSCLETLPLAECKVIVNVNAPAGEEDDTHSLRQKEVLSRLGARARLGFNIHRTDFCPDFLLEWISETGCAPVIRFGMAQPSLSGTNCHIQPVQYRAVAVRLVPFIKKAASVGVRVSFDCGFVRCMFSPAELADLAAAGADYGWHCSPVLDIDLDDRVFHCFPLAGLAALPFTPAVDAATLHAGLEERTSPYRRAGVFRECSTCSYRAAGECSGGCLSVTIRRFRHTPFHLEVPALNRLHPSVPADEQTLYPAARPPVHLNRQPPLPGGAGL